MVKQVKRWNHKLNNSFLCLFCRVVLLLLALVGCLFCRWLCITVQPWQHYAAEDDLKSPSCLVWSGVLSHRHAPSDVSHLGFFLIISYFCLPSTSLMGLATLYQSHWFSQRPRCWYCWLYCLFFCWPSQSKLNGLCLCGVLY